MRGTPVIRPIGRGLTMRRGRPSVANSLPSQHKTAHPLGSSRYRSVNSPAIAAEGIIKEKQMVMRMVTRIFSSYIDADQTIISDQSVGLFEGRRGR